MQTEQENFLQHGFSGWTCWHCNKVHGFPVGKCGCEAEIAYEKQPFTRPMDDELRELVDFWLKDNEDYQKLKSNSKHKDPYDKDWHGKFRKEFQEAIIRRMEEKKQKNEL